MKKIDVVLGLQWGDEGKGKVVDVLTPDYKVIARFQGGPNAGHSLKFDGEQFVLHTVPSGIFRPDTINIIGNGPQALSDITEVASDLKIDEGTWTCGKEQSVPVSCGIPSVLISSLTVGGE